MSDRVPVTGLAVAAAVAVALAVDAAPAGAQELVIDRWLVTGVAAETGISPLPAAGPERFPDRDLEIGPGTWTLVREDGQSRFDFSAMASGGGAVAHAYVKAPTDSDFRLTLQGDPCATVESWLNGQALGPLGSRDVRLAAGWNTLLVVVDGEGSCARALSASFSTALGPGEREEGASTVDDLRVQASRPPGARPNYPEGTISISAPRVRTLSWAGGADDLEAAVAYDLTAWGQASLGEVDEGLPDEAPEIDLTGDWDITVFGPTGIQRVIARLEMDEEGRLEGDLRSDPRSQQRQFRGRDLFSGQLREGWVSGRRFRWSMDSDIGAQSVNLEFAGAINGETLQGTIDVDSGPSDAGRRLQSRFEAIRVGGGAARPRIPEVSAAPRPDEPAPDGGDETQETLGPTDPDGLRARMIAQLRGPQPIAARAPTDGSAEVRLAGESFVAASGELLAATPSKFDASLSFRKLRDAALDDRGMRVEIRWRNGERELEGSAPAGEVLRALHAPLEITGLISGGDGIERADFRVPDALAGFTVRGVAGSWWIDGQPVQDGVLCSPCERGRRFEIGFRGPAEATPQIEITDAGYPQAGRTSGTSAADWLRALTGDNRRYRELAGG